MPLSDLFRRAPKNDPGQTQQRAWVQPSAREESLFSPARMTKPVSTLERNAQSDPLSGLIASIAKNSTDGVGNRLVIGEGTTAMGEALRNGGRYILVHPGVLGQLKANDVDAFLIYAAAMRMETAAKIPQIDFVGAKVDELLQQWSGKPEGQAPIHVRQALWLVENAESLGYKRRGDSWVLNY